MKTRPRFVVAPFSVGLVSADHPLLSIAQWLSAFLLALVADLSGLLLAVLDVAVLLGFLGTSLHLELIDLLWLETVDLLLNWEDLSGLLLAVLDVAVLLGFLRTSLHLELVDLLRLEKVDLLLNWEGEAIGELLAIPVYVSLAHLSLGLSRNVLTVLGWLLDHNVRA